MASYDTVGGGHHHHHHHHHHHDDGHAQHALSNTERFAAQQALARLAGSTAGSSRTAESTPLATTPAGGGLFGSALKPLIGGLVASHGGDTYAGGTASGSFALSRFASDTVLGGSTGPRVPLVSSTAGFSLSADTINVSGVTAAGLKSADPTHSTAASHTITLTDNTTLTITGVHSNDIIKPHGH